MPRRSGNAVCLSTREVLACLVCSLAVALVAPLVQADQSGYAEVASWMSDQKKTNGFLPGPDQLLGQIKEVDARLSPTERLKIWREWSAAQSPSITKDEIIAAVEAKRASIETARFRWSEKREYLVEQSQESLERYGRRADPFAAHEFLMKADMLKKGTQRGESFESLPPPRIKSLAGGLRRTREGDKPYDGCIYKAATLGERPRQFYFDFENPLALQMVTDTTTDFGMEFYSTDLTFFLRMKSGRVLEGRRTIDGRTAVGCALSNPPGVVVWLDPERNFAVLKVEHYDNQCEFDSDGKRVGLLDTAIGSSVECSDFVEVAEGIWLPRKAVHKWFDKNDPAKLTTTRTLAFEQLEVNGPVDDSEFTDIFPDGTLVSDTIAGTGYVQGAVSEGEETASELAASIEEPAPVEPRREVELEGPPETAVETEPAEAADTEEPAKEPSLGVRLALLLAGAAVLLVLAALYKRSRSKRANFTA